MGENELFTALERNLDRVRSSIDAACRRSGRGPGEVKLMAVTKTHPASAISAAADLGIDVFGENRVQEFQSKRSAISTNEGLGFHLIGHLQSNKSSRAVELFDSVDSVDSLRLASRLNDAAQKLGKRLPVLVEIKLGSETAKTGLEPESPSLKELLEGLPDLASLEFDGLMTVPPYSDDPEAARPYFRRLRRLREQLASANPHLKFRELSMGMSHDFPVAIEEGATMVRLGTALFGPRSNPTS